VLAFVLVLVIGVPAGVLIGVLTREGRRPRTELGFGAVTGLSRSYQNSCSPLRWFSYLP